MLKEKSLGQYFTPPTIAQFMIDLISIGSFKSRILEPSAGKGIFLDLLQKNGYSNVLGLEIDIEIAKNSNFPLKICNFFEFPTSEKFDIVIGNPPYVRWKNLTNKQRSYFNSLTSWKIRMNGLTDILQPFIFKCIDHLNPGGELIFITPFFWMQTLHSLPLRQFLKKQGFFETIINLNELRIFPNVNSNLIIFKYKKLKLDTPIKIIKIKEKKNITLIEFKLILSLLNNPKIWSRNLKQENNIVYFLTHQPNTVESWRFLPHEIETKLKSFENSCKYSPEINIEGNLVSLSNLITNRDLKKLGYSPKNLIKINLGGTSYYKVSPMSTLTNFLISNSNRSENAHKRYIKIGDIVDIGNGMVSGLDKAFQVKEEIKLNEKERKLIIPVLKARNIKRYFPKKFTDYFFIESNKISSEDVLKAEYSQLYDHLQKFRYALENRYQYNKIIPYWEWVFTRNYDLMKRAKKLICVPCKDRFDSRGYLRFALCNNGVYTTQDVSVLVKKDWVRESEEYITAFLNSTFIYEWVINKGLVRGGVVEFSERPLSLIPFRFINWKSSLELNIHQEITDLVLKIQENQEENLDIFYKINDLIANLIESGFSFE